MQAIKTLAHRCGTAALGAMLFASAVPVAHADDTEIFVGGVSTSTIQPNVLFIFDNSGSMNDAIVTQTTFDPAFDYVTSTGTCNAARVYYTTGNSVPSCSTNNYFDRTALVCNAAITAFGTAGNFRGRVARYDTSRSPTSNRRWDNLSTSARSQKVECEADSGVHGISDAATNRFAKSGTTDGYAATNSGMVRWRDYNTTRLYTANYIAWYNGPRESSRRKIDIVREVAVNLLNSTTGINVGLMYFSTNDEGGRVAVPVGDIEDNREEMIDELNALGPDTFTPLSETMYEAALYWRGATWDFGSTATPAVSVASSRQTTTTSKYKTPIEYSCQKNYIVYLTDGAPTRDTAATTKAQTLIGGNCDLNDEISATDSAATSGVCLDDLAAYLANNDVNSAIAGTQSVSTYTIGFATDQELLSQTAIRGGGRYYTANDTAELSTAFEGIIAEILDINTTFSSPTVSVNAFNRTQNLNDIYVSVFRPRLTALWPGNLKKYQINPESGEIEDAAGEEAVDPDTGFFKDSARSYWSPDVDGAQAAAGGAASQLPSPEDRKMYTYYSGSSSTALTNTANVFKTTNTALTDTLLNTATSGITLADTINWLRGQDVFDVDSDGDTAEARLRMGDPLHARPATVIYGGTASSPDASDAVVFAASNEGILQSIDVTTGEELWSFVPDTTWGSIYRALDQNSTTSKLSTLDGNVSVLRIDNNFNGVIEASDGDKVYIFFGQRRGGSNYFALDVTNKTAPIFLWKRTASDLAGLGQTWSTPQVTRVNVNGATQNAGKWALVIGGGYEVDQDPNGSNETVYSTDSTGNSIYILDAVSGTVLWRAGGAGSGATLELEKMNNAIPGDIRSIDFDGDGFLDRMYAGDMGGRVWRFDVTNGNAASSLVAGGVFAAMGDADETTHTAETNRRFYNAPDVTLVRKRGVPPYLSINIGSGYRASPLNEQISDRFYALRDFGLFSRRVQDDYDDWTPITESDLTDVTEDAAPSIPSDSMGWMIRFTRDGEKVLAEARTFSGITFFPTFTPEVETTTSSCAPRQGTNRLYAVNVLDGSPANNRDSETTDPQPEDREKELQQGGIAPETVFLFPTPPEDCVGEDCRPPPQCLVGVENCGIEFTNQPVKTFWRERAVQP